jgi:dolichyl-phosphate-mannose--protein O-mannosyl transferase
MIVEGDGADTCPPGEVITCSSEIRFTHVVTGKNLHSHRFRSPLTQEQEVSAFGEDGKGDPSDNWRVVCQSKVSLDRGGRSAATMTTTALAKPFS